MKKILFSSFFMMSLFTAYSQTEGLVLDSEGKPIDQASIFFADQNILLYTNQEGLFYFDQKVADNSYLHVYKHGYASRLIKYYEAEEVEIILEKLHVDLDEVGVTESHSELGNNRLTNIEKKSLSFLESNSMVESITELSGVDMISSGLGIQKIVIRGLSGMRVVTYLNGMQINNQQWANDHGIGFTDLGLNEVELIKGSSALKYGSEAIGGLLYFKDYPFISNDKLKGFVASKLNNSSYLTNNQIGLKWNINNFYFNVYGEYTLSTDYRLPNNDYLFNSRFKQSAYKFSIAHKYKRLQNIFRYHYHSETTGIPGHVHGDPSMVDLYELTSSSERFEIEYNETRPNQYVDNQLFIYELKYLADNLKFTFSAGQFINHLVEYEQWYTPGFDLTLTNTQLRPNITYYLGLKKNITLNIGTQITIQDNINDREANEILMPDASSFNTGVYAILDYEKNNIGFNSGLRYDYKNIMSQDESFDTDYNKSFYSTSFSSGVYYKFIDNIFRITYSGAYRAPHFAELFSDGVHHGTNRYEIGSEDLNIEYSNQIDFKYQWSNNHLGFVLNPFVQYISDFISISPTGSNNGSYREYQYLQYDNVELKGLEMNIHYHPHKLHNLHLEQSYSFLQATNKDSDYGLALVPANSIKSKVLFDFSSYEKLSIYKLDYFSLYHIYKFQQDIHAEYEEPTTSYNVVSLMLGFKINDKLHCSLGVNNLFNEEYTPHISRVRGVAGGIPNPGRFLNMNFRYEF